MKREEIGCFTFVLNGHIPYCRKAGVWPFGEEWVLEAMAETYIPLLRLLYSLNQKGVNYRVTLSFTPILLEQISDGYMVGRFREYLKDRIRRAQEDVGRFQMRSERMLEELATQHLEHYSSVEKAFEEDFNGDIVGAFRSLQDDEKVEIIASVATHGYLPLMDETSIYAQMKVGVETYEKHFQRSPRGMWLPECGYRPDGSHKGKGIERIAEDLNIEYFFVDSHGIRGGQALGLYGDKSSQLNSQDSSELLDKNTYRPYYLIPGKVSVFGRNEETGLQVWSSEWGYPGDGYYREFHKRDSLSGFRYWRVTSKLLDLDGKELYDREEAMKRVEAQSDHFVQLVDELLGQFHSGSQDVGILTAPYDVELFGHWWFEGIEWLGKVLEKMEGNPRIRMVTGSEYIEDYPPEEVISLKESSWGLGGKHYLWENPETTWMWNELDKAAQSMRQAVMKAGNGGELEKRVLSQAARELMLLQSSDWPFLVTTGQASEYAAERFREHKERFHWLMDAIEENEPHDELLVALAQIEEEDNPFPDLDYRIYGQ